MSVPHTNEVQLTEYRGIGEMAERLNAAVLKTVLGNTNGGSNPSLSANLKTDTGP